MQRRALYAGASDDLSPVNVAAGRVEALEFHSVVIETEAMAIRYFAALHCVKNNILTRRA